MNLFPTKKRNVFVVIQTRDLNDIRPRLEGALKKFDKTVLEISQPNRREDVIKVETILGNTGHHDLSRTDGPLGWWGERQEKAVKAWQGDNGLKVDGLLKPNGPTISSLKKSTGGLLGGFKPRPRTRWTSTMLACSRVKPASSTPGRHGCHCPSRSNRSNWTKLALPSTRIVPAR